MLLFDTLKLEQLPFKQGSETPIQTWVAYYELATYMHANGGSLWAGAEADFLEAPAELEPSGN